MTFSDLVLQLFAFVLVAVVLGNARQSASAAAAKASPTPAAEAAPAVPAADAAAALPAPVAALPPTIADPAPTPLPRALQELVDIERRNDGVTVTVRDSDVVLSLSDRITFPSGSADLLPAARPLLARIGSLAAAMPDCSIEVAGHTDDVPIHTGEFPSNLELSLARAARVVRELTAGSLALSERMVATGFGEHRPVAPNQDETGRAQNRRVEIRFVPRARMPARSLGW